MIRFYYWVHPAIKYIIVLLTEERNGDYITQAITMIIDIIIITPQ